MGFQIQLCYYYVFAESLTETNSTFGGEQTDNETWILIVRLPNASRYQRQSNVTPDMGKNLDLANSRKLNNK